MPDTILYAILEIRRDATEPDIKLAYRKLALKYHPDKNRDKNREEKLQAENNFKKIAFARDILTDENKRAIYDRDGILGLVDAPAGLFDLPPGTAEQPIYDVDIMLTELLIQVARSFRLGGPRRPHPGIRARWPARIRCRQTGGQSHSHLCNFRNRGPTSRSC